MVEMAELLQFVVDEGVSDLHIEVGVPPVVRLHGDMTQMNLPPLTAEDTERLVKSIASEVHIQKIQRHTEIFQSGQGHPVILQSRVKSESGFHVLAHCRHGEGSLAEKLGGCGGFYGFPELCEIQKSIRN